MKTAKLAPWPFRAFFWIRRVGYRFETLKRRSATGLFKLFFSSVYGKNVSYQGIEDFSSEWNSRWSTLAPNKVQLTIVIVSYKQPAQLECLLASLICQTLQNFEVLIIHDGPDAETRTVAETFAKRSTRFRYLETDKRYNDYGHSLRDLGLEAAMTDYLLITNGDNYYMPRFTEFVFEAIETHHLDMAIWDIVHSYTSPGKISQRCYNPFRIYPVRWMVDIGAVIVRTELAKLVGFADKSFDGDATYVEDILSIKSRPIKVGKIEKTLTVHN